MGSFIAMAQRGAASHMQAQIASRDASETVRQANIAFGQQFAEGERQKESVTHAAQAVKSARVREADKTMGTMIAVMADNGGMGTTNMVRYGGEIDYLAEMDVHKIEYNRIQQVNAINASVSGAYNNAMNVITSARRAAIGAWMNMLVGGAGAFADAQKQAEARREQTKRGNLEGGDSNQFEGEGTLWSDKDFSDF